MAGWAGERIVSTREDLRSQLIAAFSAQDDIYQVAFFGREVEGLVDRYSDIDLLVCSNDLAATRATYRDVFASISPIRATLPLARGADGLAEMIMLHGYSPYCKVDFSFHARLDDKAEYGPFAIAYESREKAQPSRTTLDEPPIVRDVAHRLHDILFSVPRFTKCLFRRDPDMYRRWKSITEATLVLLYEAHFGWDKETSRKALAPHEAKRLYARLAPGERARVHAIYPLDARLDLAASYQASIHLFADLSRHKAAHFEAALDDDLSQYICAFMDAEIRRYRK